MHKLTSRRMSRYADRLLSCIYLNEERLRPTPTENSKVDDITLEAHWR